MKRIIEPIENYKNEVKPTLETEIQKMVQTKIEKSNIDLEQNKKQVAEIDETTNLILSLSKNKSLLKTFRIILIILGIGALILAISGFYSLTSTVYEKPTLFQLLATILGSTIALFSLFFTIFYLNKKIKGINLSLADETELNKKLIDQATKSIAAFCEQFQPEDTLEILNRAVPQIKLDKFNTAKRMSEMFERGFPDHSFDNDITTRFIQSGIFGENPFMIYKINKHKMSSETYVGSIVISWSETYTNTQGEPETRTRTQTLTASYTAPKPSYQFVDILTYINESVPSVDFDRTVGKYTTERKIEKKSKDMNIDFNAMSNIEFESKFNAKRNDEIGFRTLFSALAQENIVKLINTNDEDVQGDHFNFWKEENIFYITSDCLNTNFDYKNKYYSHYSAQKVIDKFKKFNENYIKNIYFSLSPIMAIPILQETSLSDLYTFNEKDKISYQEAEYLAHSIDPHQFFGKDVDAEVIWKISKSDNDENTIVTGMSYNAYERVHLSQQYGQDGEWHTVPVIWYEYIPIVASKDIKLADLNGV
ncbi:MAG1210 family protein [Mesoplasma photuris]|uniref:MAG1210 family protein n=1 Tax=Mesoplasma photuris TaxID=217731 RepID=UPI0004E28BEB|nr:hypothetical protein [Mesoplasma photuris]